MYNHFHHNNYVILSPLSHIWYMIIYIENINIFDLLLISNSIYVVLNFLVGIIEWWIIKKWFVDIEWVKTKHRKYRLFDQKNII